ncbi:MAG: hypothetical protein IJZ85_10555 [Lachnospiraceae bacterium]|nr:hypothetical protein [Lachnospiraceae bacterium]
MDYLFRLADGRRVALWSEKNQIIRQLSGGGNNRSHMTLRTDFLSDFSAAAIEGRIYFTYQNTSRRVMLYLPDGEEDRMLFGESIESCRHSGMTLTAWKGRLYLFYTAWSPIREKYALKVRTVPETAAPGGAVALPEGSEKILAQDFGEPPEFQVISDQGQLRVIAAERCWRMSVADNEAESWEEGIWTAAETVDGWERMRKEAEEEKVNMLQMISAQKQLAEKVSESEAEKRRLLEENGELQAEQDRLKQDMSGYQEEIQRLSEECEKCQLESQRAKDDLREALAENRARLQSAVTQYNDLAEVARQLQIEGKKWRDKYYQEAKKRRGRQAESD